MALGAGKTELTIDKAGSNFYANFRSRNGTFETRLKDYKVGLLPFIKDRLAAGEIKFIQDFYTKVDDNNNLTEDEKQRVKSEVLNLFNSTFESPSDETLEVLRLSQGSVTYEDLSSSAAIASGRYGVLNARLKRALEKKINTNIEKGFSEFFGAGDYQKVDDLLESTAQTGNVAQLKSALAGLGKDSDSTLSKAPPLEARQCALMSIMYSNIDWYKFIHDTYQEYDEDGNRTADEDGGIVERFAFDGRIIPFSTTKPSPTMGAAQINNYFTANEDIKKFFETEVQDTELNKALFFVYKDINDGIMKEIKLNLSSHDGKEISSTKLDEIYQQLMDHETGKTALSSAEIQNLEQDKRNIFATLTTEEPELDENGQPTGRNVITTNSSVETQAKGLTAGENGTFTNFHTEKISIKFDGTNPSTARNDVKVTVVIQLETFKALQTSIIQSPIASTGRTDFKLQDLIIAPIGDDSQTGALAAITNVYSPSNNRVRLKVAADPANGVLPNGSGYTAQSEALVLDLALVDHSLERSNDSSAVTLTINYRGYMETLMQMPYANVLMTKDIYDARKQRHANIKKILNIDGGCRDSTLREILRIERDTAETEIRNNFSEVLGRLYEDRKVYGYNKKDSKKSYRDIAGNIVKSGKNNEISFYGNRYIGGLNIAQEAVVSVTDVPANEQEAVEKVAEEGLEEATSGANFYAQIATRGEDNLGGERDWGNLVFFGDLLYTISDVLYNQKGKFDTIDEIYDDLYFALFPIQLPDPTSQQKFREFNPMAIPIDLFFFAQWWHETIVKKELTYYPISAFIRDLVERMINNLLYEVCVSSLLPDESPPLLKVSYFTSQVDMEDSSAYMGNSLYDYEKNIKPFFLHNYFSTEKKEGVTSPREVSNKNYIVLHVVSPPFRREIAVNQDRKNQLRNSDFVPTLIHGVFTRDKRSHVDNVTFSKTNSPGLREARYFNNTFGNVAIMNNVYDLSFSIMDNNANTYLYPGMIINFILSDFEMGRQVTQTGKPITSKVGHQSYIGTDNDPHNSSSLAHKLGYGGYFIIKSISYELLKGSSGGKWQINCEAKFIGTDGDQRVEQSDDDIRTIITGDKADCIDVYDEAVRFNQTAVDAYNNDAGEDEQRQKSYSTIGSENSTYVDPNAPKKPPSDTDSDGISDGDDAKKEKQTTDGVKTISIDEEKVKALMTLEYIEDKGKKAGSTQYSYVKAGGHYFKLIAEGGASATSQHLGVTKPADFAAANGVDKDTDETTKYEYNTGSN